MKIQLDFTDDDNLLLDIREALFVTLLKAELTDSKIGLEKSFHKDDKVMFKSNIKACKALLSYYTGEDDGQA